MAGQPIVITGIVFELQGRPVEGARVYFVAGPVSLPETAFLTDRDGKFSLSAPVAGTYQIGCSADGFASTTVTVKVTSGQDAKLEIRLKQ